MHELSRWCRVDSLAAVQVFDRVAEAKAAGLPVLDWGVHNASLEDVFIRLATRGGAEHAQPDTVNHSGAS
jgi:hypothetical protein